MYRYLVMADTVLTHALHSYSYILAVAILLLLLLQACGLHNQA